MNTSQQPWTGGIDAPAFATDCGAWPRLDTRSSEPKICLEPGQKADDLRKVIRLRPVVNVRFAFVHPDTSFVKQGGKMLNYSRKLVEEYDLSFWKAEKADIVQHFMLSDSLNEMSV